jgi:hypothetical protein
MRTKTLLLSAIVGALSSASLMAQVYSLNAVGYINVSVPPQFSIIANQLNTTNNNISPLLDSQLLDGNHSGVTLFKYAGGYSSFSVSGTSWSSTAVTNTTINPGEAVFIYNPFTTSFNLTFVGTVLTGSLTNSLLSGFNLVSSMTPQSGPLDTALGLVPAVGDTAFPYAGGYSPDSYGGSGWSVNNAAPSIAVGQGLFYYSAAGQKWIQNFSVN